MEPVAIRTKNPGAMWPGPASKKFGSTSYINLKDGNKAAIFPTFEQGAAAQFYLWSTRYSGMTLADAIKKWSGHNSSAAYAAFMKKRVGVAVSDQITKEFLASEQGWKFMKAQAQWEAGKPYPMTDAQWKAGQAMAFGIKPVVETAKEEKVKNVKTGTINTGAIVRQGGIIAASVGGFLTDWKMAAVIVVSAVAAVAIWVALGRPKVWKKEFWA